MDIRELKDLLKNSTSVLILDEGEPAYVILDYQVYRNLTQEQEVPVRSATQTPSSAPAPSQQLSAQEMEALERLNREIQALKDQIEQEERSTGLNQNQE